MITAAASYFLKEEREVTHDHVVENSFAPETQAPEPQRTPAANAPAFPVKNGRKILSALPKGKDRKDSIDKLMTVNSVSPDWQEKLEENLKIQGGEEVKEVKVTKVDSVIINRDGNPTNAESVVVVLKNERGEVSKFRAMIDSQSGRILETWDRPVSDPILPREEFKLKVDSRYNL